ncbi:J domain-containing protein [Iamia majanohamensis]|uniref:J domain-containing protein n=1 Tax=Iamia majanohamensis TaxID=467976 RepID=A0AAF0BTP3_9ACTN|nr:J domain-containing protein [Iamia majanohamensis]WCO65095.1 J domain-containing protein [Iamia majanohamensis]
MDRAEAARLLGIAPDAGPDEARRAFRTLIRRHHPDRAGAGAEATSARLIEAHRTLRAPPPPDDPGPTPPPGPVRRAPRPNASPPVDARADGDALVVRAEPEVVLARVVEAGHRLGEVTYLDRASGLVEVLLQVQDEGDDHPTAVSLVASLQGRAEAVEVFCTVERLDGHAAPPVAPLVAALASAMRGGDPVTRG